MTTALIVDDDPASLTSLEKVFSEHGYSTQTADSLAKAREYLLGRVPEVALFSEHVNGDDVLGMLESLELGDVIELYLMSSQQSVGSATRAMRIGATDYFGKPVDTARLAENLETLNRELSGDAAANNGRGPLVGESKPMQKLYRLIRKIAPTDASVLLTGESGTGKELVSRAIHELSKRTGGSLVAVNCSAVPKELMESELFGHKKGSFTGATRDHRGFFERADGGTLFLDEITEMDPALQAKLLRVLEVDRVRPIGSESEVTVDVRIIAATNQDPSEAVADGRLREDLYYRLAQFPLRIPPLRERADDIELLAMHFLAEQNEIAGVKKSFGDDVLAALRQHDWPGNVRELRNAVIHGHLIAGREIRVDDLPDGLPATGRKSGDYVRTMIGASLAEVERRHILATLAHYEGNKKKTAEVLGVSLKTLYNRLKRYESK